MHAPLLTPRLRLRPFREDDLDALHAMWNDPAVAPWIGWDDDDPARSREALAAHLRHQEEHGFSVWAVEEQATGAVVGEIGLQLLQHAGPEVEIGWVVSAAGRGRGYAFEAASRWLQVGFGELGLDRIVAVVLPRNTVSRRLAERLGMREAGTRRAYGAEHVLYAIER